MYRERVIGKPELSGAVVVCCWVRRGNFVFAVFEDGDAYRIPSSVIEWSVAFS